LATATSGVSPTTVTFSASDCTDSAKSTVLSVPTTKVISRLLAPNPCSSTVMSYGAGCSETAR
jgi:hypothetical protein